LLTPARSSGAATRYALRLDEAVLDPHWFNTVRYGEHAGEVIAPRLVQVRDKRLRFAEIAGLPVGTAITLWLNGAGHFVCTPTQELQREQAERAAAEEARRAAVRQAHNRQREQARTFNATLKVPVKWVPGIKDVLSGLSERSVGDGRNRATVEHILLLEPLQDGRLKRAAGDFLCSSNPRMNGKRWSGQPGSVAFDEDGGAFAPAVSCEHCLRLALRWTDAAATSRWAGRTLESADSEDAQLWRP
jgi:hypothetical protein